MEKPSHDVVQLIIWFTLFLLAIQAPLQTSLLYYLYGPGENVWFNLSCENTQSVIVLCCNCGWKMLNKSDTFPWHPLSALWRLEMFRKYQNLQQNAGKLKILSWTIAMVPPVISRAIPQSDLSLQLFIWKLIFYLHFQIWCFY